MTEYPPISDYALLSDCHGAALVSTHGSVDWCCFHRVDASPVFARLIDWTKGGYWSIAPDGEFTPSRRYADETNVLETRFETDAGIAVVTDCLTLSDDNESQHTLVRIVRCESGRADLHMVFRPRFDYGLTIPRFEQRGAHSGVVVGGADGLTLCGSVELTPLGDCTAEARIALTEGEEAFVATTYLRSHRLEERTMSLGGAKRAVEHTVEWWREWSDRFEYNGSYPAPVRRSALVLKAMSNAPTGAIAAAPTTSLPEEIGGQRNWDYRYAWMRDAAMNLYSLFQLGYREEAHDFMQWLQRTTAGRAEDLQVLYGVGGERLVPEHLLEFADGYRGSRPVRIGNAASSQFQLDVYGYLLDTAWLYHRHGGHISEGFWEFVRGAIDVVAERWEEPDSGIWEVRGGPQHFVSSKVMGWVAVDRAIRLARARRLPADAAWNGLRDRIRDRVLTEGVDAKTGAFVQSFGSNALDASTLLIPLVRFLPATDPRMLATIDRIDAELTSDGLVYRYLDTDDGLPGNEATFLICSFWLVDNLALAGRVDRARQLFERLLAFANDVGLLSEEVDPKAGALLGNFPQAFSHVGLIGAALNLDAAARSRAV